MKFLEKLFGKKSESKVAENCTQAEREAIVDLLTLAVYIDDHLSLSESAAFDDSVGLLGWESGTAPSLYISMATDRARRARSTESGVNEWIDFAAQRLSSGAARERAMNLLNRLFLSDGKTDREKAFFDAVKARFRESRNP